MQSVTITVLNAGTLSLALSQAAARVLPEAAKVTRAHGHLMRTRVMAKASGRPGPNAPTGDYRRSWGVQFSSGPGEVSASVGTNAPQGRRLEMGFYGADSLGRVYSQPPLPHVGPAFDEVSQDYVRAMRAMVGRVMP